MELNSGLLWYRLVDATRDQQLESFEKSTPTYRRSLEYFQANASSISSVDQLMKDRRALEVVLSAFQLEEQIDSRALIEKIMTEPVNERSSLVNRLAEPRYRQLAEFIQPLAAGENPFSDPEYVDTVVQGFRVNEFEKAQNEKNPGLREAMYFKRKIGTAENVSQIMADPVLKEVVRVALGLPEAFGALEFDQQKDRFEKSLNMDDFKDPKLLDRFIDRFLIQNDQELGVTGGADPIVSLFSPAPNGPVNFVPPAPGTLNVLI